MFESFINDTISFMVDEPQLQSWFNVSEIQSINKQCHSFNGKYQGYDLYFLFHCSLISFPLDLS